MLTVCEIFYSVQGETTRVGLPFVFIRLSGCNLRCTYCDTRYAWEGPGMEMSVADVLARASAFGVRRVCITGGEPLCQSETPALAAGLLSAGCEVLVETNGSLDISVLPPGCRRIVDFKAPDSGMADRMDWANAGRLCGEDEVKVVCASRADYEWARDDVLPRVRKASCPVLLSAAHPRLEPAALAAWMLADRLDARLQVQLHRILWPDVERGV